MNKLEQRFSERLNDLIQFKNTNDGWPDLLSKDFDERSLGVWCHKIRLNFNKGALDETRRSALERIGFSFNPMKDTWHKSFKNLKEYVQKHKMLPGVKEKTMYTFSLNQYRIYERLPDEKKKALQSFNFLELWKNRERDLERKWDEHLKEVKEFVKIHDVLPTRKTNLSLEYWVNAQRKFWEKGVLTRDQKQKIKEAGIDLFNRSFRKKEWEERYEQVKAFMKKNNSLPKSTVSAPNERQLYLWCIRQRRLIENDKLPSNLADKFQKIKFSIAKEKSGFDEVCARLLQFKKDSGRWPKREAENKEERFLASWCNGKKTKYYRGKLTEYELKALKKIHFPFERKTRTEEQAFAELKDYIKENKKFPSRDSLYQYFYIRKFNFENSDEELKRLLKSIGFKK